MDLIRFERILAARGGADATAATILSCADARFAESGTAGPAWLQRHQALATDLLRGQLDAEAFRDAWERGRALPEDEAIAMALAVHAIASTEVGD